MKLIQKTARYYLGYTFFILSIGTALFYFLIRIVLIDSVDEALRQEKNQIIKNLNYEIIIDSIQPTPNVTIRKTFLHKTYPEKFRIVKIYVEEDEDFVDYREVKKIIKYKDDYYELVIRQSLKEAEALLFSLLPAVAGLFLFILVGVFFINAYVNRRVWKPFYQLVDKLRHYDLLKSKFLAYRHSDISEFNELSLSVEKMTRQIHQDFIRQKEFNENSSHEMQTPLAIIRNKLDLLIQSKNLGEKELILIEGIYESQKRLTLLNKGLLLISKIDNHQFNEEEFVDMDAAIRKSVEQFMPQVEEKELRITIDIQEKVTVKFNAILADILLNNLISNAIKHNYDKGYILIMLNETKLVIENSGEQLTLDPDLLFERFRKNSTSENSIGLGLAIVKKITDLFSFVINYINDDGIHTITIKWNQSIQRKESGQNTF